MLLSCAPTVDVQCGSWERRNLPSRRVAVTGRVVEGGGEIQSEVRGEAKLPLLSKQLSNEGRGEEVNLGVSITLKWTTPPEVLLVTWKVFNVHLHAHYNTLVLLLNVKHVYFNHLLILAREGHPTTFLRSSEARNEHPVNPFRALQGFRLLVQVGVQGC